MQPVLAHSGVVTCSAQRRQVNVFKWLAILLYAVLFVTFAVCAWYWPLKLPEPVLVSQTTLNVGAGSISMLPNQRHLVAEVRELSDEFDAWLLFSFLRGREFRGHELLMVHDRLGPERKTRLVVRMNADMLAGVPAVVSWHAEEEAEQEHWGLVTNDVVNRWRQQTRIYEAAYSIPVKLKLEDLPRRTVHEYIRRFIQFKSTTDPRVRKRNARLPILTELEAHRLAGDIITVAQFYDIPLDVFLGIGAMENNYMNVRGDLANMKWKRRPAKDDIILGRKGGRVLVWNDSMGVWQITRETLRYAHKLYVKDERDYSLLPEHLRPPMELDVNNVDPLVLTTYAGLLLRDLIDEFDGDITTAVGAYNGGPANPNPRYAAGVQRVAQYARTVLERAAVWHGHSIADLRLMRPSK